MEKLALPVGGPLDLKATLRPLHGHFMSDGWWLTARTPDGTASLRVRRTKEQLIGEAWGEGSGWLLARLGRICGLEDHPEAFQTDHPVVSEIHRRSPGARFGRTDLVFQALLPVIAAQRVTGREASAAMKGLSRRFGEPAPGPRPDLKLPPDPGRLAEAPYWMFHELHLEKRRADLIRRVAARASEIDALAEESSLEASRYLMALSGIAEWTVAGTLAPSHGDPDQVAVGDFHLKHLVVYHLTGRPRGSDEEMLELLEPFRPHRGRVARLLHTLGHAPKFGPRMAPRDITRL